MSAFDDAWPALFHVKHDSGFACSGLEHKWSSLLGSNLMPKRNLSSQLAEGFHALGAPPDNQQKHSTDGVWGTSAFAR